MPHQKLFLFSCIVLFYISSKAQYPILEIEKSEEEPYKCLNVTYKDKHGEVIEPPLALQPFINCESNIAQSGDGSKDSDPERYIAFIDKLNVQLFDLKTQTLSTLLTLPSNSQGQSELLWETNGGDDDTTELSFIDINRYKYGKGSKLFILSIAAGHLVKKIMSEIPAKVNYKGNKCEIDGFDFYDGVVEYKTADPQDLKKGMKVRRFISSDDIEDEKSILYIGSDDWWSIAEKYYYVLADKSGNEIALPHEVEKAIRFSPLVKISPDFKKMIYRDHRQVKMYDFNSHKITTVVTLFSNSTMTEDIIWTGDSKRFAFICNNEEKYTFGKKLFVYDIANGSTQRKKEFDISAKGEYFVTEDDFKFMDKNTIFFLGDKESPNGAWKVIRKIFDGCYEYVIKIE